MKKSWLLLFIFFFPFFSLAYDDGIYDVMDGTAITVKYGDIAITVQKEDLPGHYYWGVNEVENSDYCGLHVTPDFEDKIKNGIENDNARGGGEDNYQNGYDSLNNRKLRQGPCEEGWHVPSKKEWSDLLYARCLGSDYECGEDNISWERNGIIHALGLDDKGMLEGHFKSDFNIYDDYPRYWSSSPRNIGNLHTTAWVAFLPRAPEWNSARDTCWKVRCFKNEADFSVSRFKEGNQTNEKYSPNDDLTRNCLDIIFKNGDSMCLSLALKEDETISEFVSLYPRYEYTLERTPTYVKISDKYLSDNFEPMCNFAIGEGGQWEKCDLKTGRLDHIEIIPEEKRGNNAPFDYRIAIEYPKGKIEYIDISLNRNERFAHYYRDGRFERADGEYDIKYSQPNKNYYLGNKIYGIDEEYTKITEVLYSSDRNNWQDITNNWKAYIEPYFGRDKLIYNISIKILDGENNVNNFFKEVYVKKIGFYKFKFEKLTKEHQKVQGFSEIEAPVLTKKISNNGISNVNTKITNDETSKEEKVEDNPLIINEDIKLDSSNEFNEAYKFAYKNGITTMDAIENADMNGGLNRIAMAKMLSNYAMNILGKKPANIIVPDFPDVSEELNENYGGAVDLAYQLGIMGIGTDKFRPYDSVTRAEFATALSRMLYGLEDGIDNYYSTHIDKLYQEGIISNKDPNLKELRGYVMLMLMRSYKAEEDTVTCTMEYNPVCGKNGKKYGNKCFMEIDGVEESQSAKIVNDECVYN